MSGSLGRCHPAVAALAPDLSRVLPRSPRIVLGGYVALARTVDKCRAELNGSLGDYRYWPCALSARLMDFTGFSIDQFREKIASGITDAEVARWLQTEARVRDPYLIGQWNAALSTLRLNQLPPKLYTHLNNVLPTLPKHRLPKVWFDLYDLDEGRL